MNVFLFYFVCYKQRTIDTPLTRHKQTKSSPATPKANDRNGKKPPHTPSSPESVVSTEESMPSPPPRQPQQQHPPLTPPPPPPPTQPSQVSPVANMASASLINQREPNGHESVELADIHAKTEQQQHESSADASSQVHKRRSSSNGGRLAKNPLIRIRIDRRKFYADAMSTSSSNAAVAAAADSLSMTSKRMRSLTIVMMARSNESGLCDHTNNNHNHNNNDNDNGKHMRKSITFGAPTTSRLTQIESATRHNDDHDENDATGSGSEHETRETAATRLHGYMQGSHTDTDIFQHHVIDLYEKSPSRQRRRGRRSVNANAKRNKSLSSLKMMHSYESFASTTPPLQPAAPALASPTVAADVTPARSASPSSKADVLTVAHSSPSTTPLKTASNIRHGGGLGQSIVADQTTIGNNITMTTNYINNNNNSNNKASMVKKRAKIDIKRERKAAKTLGVIMSCFILCWLPFFLFQLLFSFCKTCTLTVILENNWLFTTIITWSGYVNSMLNPIIYTVFSPDFRSAFSKILLGKYSKRINR